MANEFEIHNGLLVNGSGSTIVDIQGSNGQLFSVVDSLSGSLMSVNNISGIPVFEVFSDNTVKIGTFGQEAIVVNGSVAIVSGSFSGSFVGDGSGLTGITGSGGGVTSIATNNGITGGTITSTGTIGLTGQALALHNLATNGMIARTGAGTVAGRTITAGTGVTVTNGNGVSGNPTIEAVNIPQSTNTTLVSSDKGKFINATSGRTINSSTGFAVGDMVTIYNNSAGNITITATGITLRLAGTATTGNRTLAQRGIATVLCVASNDYVISGAGLT